MPAKIIGENVQFRIEVEDNPLSILLVLDRKCDWAIVPWEDAFNLAGVMEQVISDVGHLFPKYPDRDLVLREQAQVRLNLHKGLVALLFDWTDRVRFTTLEAFFLVQRALRVTAQDANLEGRGLRFEYDKQGLIKKVKRRDEGSPTVIRR